MKGFFSTPKKAILLVFCMVAVIAAVSITIVKSTLITKAEAKTVALRDAGLSEGEASALRARLEFDDGRFQYEVDFYNNGTEYEYLIQAKDGDIIARDVEGEANGNHYGQEMQQNAKSQPDVDGDRFMQPREAAVNQSAADGNISMESQETTTNQPAAGGNSSVQPQGKSVEEAKAAALRDAGLSEADVTFKKAELDYDHGIQVYDIEFYTSDGEYDYEINASDGTVLEKSIEQFRTPANPADTSSYIGVDQAKEIALNHVGLNESDVRFEKAKLEHDDGGAEYEVEFYFGRTEYDYTIDAVSGNIIEHNVDYD